MRFAAAPRQERRKSALGTHFTGNNAYSRIH
jgi:hypothetical protein